MPFSIPHLATWPASKTRSATHSPSTSVDLSAIPENFGVPSVDDPDPYGVLALEQAGLEIKEAGSASRPNSDNFEFRPSPTSPVYRQSFMSLDGVSRHKSWRDTWRDSKRDSKRNSKRDSKRSMVSVDCGTQTADLPLPSPDQDELHEASSVWSGPTRPDSRPPSSASAIGRDKHIEAWNASVGPHHEDDDSAYFSGIAEAEQGHEAVSPKTSVHRRTRSLIPTTEQPIAEEAEPAEPPSRRSSSASADSHVEEHDEEEHVEEQVEPVIVAQVVHAAQAAPAVKVVAQSVTSPRAKLVTIRGRAAPALPARNPLRARRALDGESHDGSAGSLSSSSPSPTRSAFDRTDDASNPWSEQTSIPDLEKTSVLSSKRNSVDDRVSAKSSPLADEYRPDSEVKPGEEQAIPVAVTAPEVAAEESQRAGTKADQPESISTTDAQTAAAASDSQTTPVAVEQASETIFMPVTVEEAVTKPLPLLVPSQEAITSDTASISDYGDDDQGAAATDDGDMFHSMPATPHPAEDADPLDSTAVVPALPQHPAALEA